MAIGCRVARAHREQSRYSGNHSNYRTPERVVRACGGGTGGIDTRTVVRDRLHHDLPPVRLG